MHAGWEIWVNLDSMPSMVWKASMRHENGLANFSRRFKLNVLMWMLQWSSWIEPATHMNRASCEASSGRKRCGSLFFLRHGPGLASRVGLNIMYSTR